MLQYYHRVAATNQSGQRFFYMINLKAFIAIASVEFARVGLQQAEIIPAGVWEVFKDFPLLAMVMVIIYFIARWFEKILNDQRTSLKEIYEGNQKILLTLMKQIEGRQDHLDDGIEKISGEIALMRSTLAEVANVNDVVDQLMDRLPRPTDSRSRRSD